MVQRTYIILIITMLIWGLNAVAGKLAVGHVSPLLLTFLRWMLATAFILMISYKNLIEDWPILRPRLLYLFLLAGFGYSGFNALMYFGLNHTSALNISIIQATVPILIFFINYLFFRERASFIQFFAFFLTVLGILLIASNGDLTTLSNFQINIGDLLMLVAVVFYSFYTVFLRWKPDVHWKSLMSILAICALIISIFPALYEWNAGNMLLPDNQGMLLLLFIAIFPSLVSQVLFIRATDRLGANRAGLFVNLVPVFGAGFSVLILGEVVGYHHILALLFVFSGIGLSEYWKSRCKKSIAAE